MKRIVAGAVLLCLLPLSVAYGWQGYVVKVLDGDSLRVERSGKIIEIRLYGIDSPEWGQDYGNRAKRYLKSRVNHRTVTVEPKDVDRYGRTVALVSSSGRLMNREMVEEGLAWMYPKYCKEQPLCSDLQRVEEHARARRRGLWREKKPISPWHWKWQNRKKKQRR